MNKSNKIPDTFCSLKCKIVHQEHDEQKEAKIAKKGEKQLAGRTTLLLRFPRCFLLNKITSFAAFS
jgi:hypothetical protein